MTGQRGAAVLNLVREQLTRYVIFPSDEAADATTLWIAATHGQPAWECAPRLQIRSPLPRCGKSRLLDMVEALAHEPLMMVLASAAALFRSIDGDEPPTLLLDETDTIFGGRDKTESQEAIRGILNAGHQRGRTIPRCVPPSMEVRHFPTFAMAALAGIGSLPDTIEDRSVIIELRRRAPGESVAKLRWKRVRPSLHALRDQLSTWVRGELGALRNADPELPVDDRAADTWEPLVAVADAAGADWPARAREACRVLCSAAAGSDIDSNLGVRLLADLRDIFQSHEPADRAHTDALLTELRKIGEAPWHDFYGHPFDARDMAKLLRPYNVKSKDVWINGVNHKGYRVEDLWDTWQRYLPPAESPEPAPASPGQPDLWSGEPYPGARSARSARSGSDQGERPSPSKTGGARSARHLADLAPSETQGLGADQPTSAPSPPSPDPWGPGPGADPWAAERAAMEDYKRQAQHGPTPLTMPKHRRN